jgi:hypothetical protein
MNDRTRVLVTDIGGSLLTLVIRRQSRQWLPEEYCDDLAPRSVLISAISGFGEQYITEHDPVAAKLDQFNYLLAYSLALYVYHRLLRRFGLSRDSFTTGHLVGIILYRVVFGVIFDVPQARFQQFSYLDWLRRSTDEASE